MKRKSMNPKKDHKIFSNTAVKIKKINVMPGNPRGGRRM